MIISKYQFVLTVKQWHTVASIEREEEEVVASLLFFMLFVFSVYKNMHFKAYFFFLVVNFLFIFKMLAMPK